MSVKFVIEGTPASKTDIILLTTLEHCDDGGVVVVCYPNGSAKLCLVKITEKGVVRYGGIQATGLATEDGSTYGKLKDVTNG